MTCRDCIGALTESYMEIRNHAQQSDVNAAAMELNNLNDFLHLKKKHCPCGCVDDLMDEVNLTHSYLTLTDLPDVHRGIDGIHGAICRLMQLKAGEI